MRHINNIKIYFVLNDSLFIIELCFFIPLHQILWKPSLLKWYDFTFDTLNLNPN